jgi:hypothetical protein
MSVDDYNEITNKKPVLDKMGRNAQLRASKCLPSFDIRLLS